MDREAAMARLSINVDFAATALPAAPGRLCALSLGLSLLLLTGPWAA